MPDNAQKTHCFDLDWEGIFSNYVEDAPEHENYYYFNEALKDSPYYESTYICPFCEKGTDEDGTPTYPILMKLKIRATTTRRNGTSYELFNLFTCCDCRRFFASIHKINGNPIWSKEPHATGLSPALREYALISKPYDCESWKSIVKQSERLIEDPRETKAVIAETQNSRQPSPRVFSKPYDHGPRPDKDYIQSALKLLAYLKAIRDSDLLSATLTLESPADGVQRVDDAWFYIVEAMRVEGVITEESAYGTFPVITETLDSIPNTTMAKLLMSPLYYVDKCIIQASSKASDETFKALALTFMSVQRLYDKWDPQELATYLVASYPDGAKSWKQAHREIDKRFVSMGLKPSRDIPDETKTSSKGCYIATAAYGSYDCPQVWTLRRYRDCSLAKTAWGRAFIKTYYAISPLIVERFGDSASFNRAARRILDKFVESCRKKGYSSEPYKDQSW